MARRKTTTSTRRGNNTSARRGNSTPSRRGSNTTNTNNETEAGAPPSHRTADQLKGVLRSTTTTVQPDPVQTAADQRRAIQLMPKELDAALGMRRLQLGLDSHQTRQQELARLEIEDPVGHYYAQTPAERAPFQLQAAAVLFEMSGGDVSVPVAALTLMRLRRDEKEMAERKAGAMLLGAWRAAKAKKEAGEVAETGEEVGEGGRKRKRRLPAEEEVGGEPPEKKKSVRFGRED